MSQPQIFDVLLLIARPAAGKSEILRYLRNTSPADRQNRFRIGQMREFDDFPMLWTWFEEDDLLQKAGHPRLHTEADGHFKWTYLWDVLIERLCLEYQKARRDDPPGGSVATSLIEFARGSQHGGFQRAFEHLSPEVLQRAAIVYINVPWEESLRKNRRRFNPNRPDSILEHGMDDETLTKLYKESDWAEVSAQNPDFLTIQGCQVPYQVFENQDDVTTAGGEPLGARLEETLQKLWQKWSGTHAG